MNYEEFKKEMEDLSDKIKDWNNIPADIEEQIKQLSDKYPDFYDDFFAEVVLDVLINS